MLLIFRIILVGVIPGRNSREYGATIPVYRHSQQYGNCGELDV